MAWEKVQGMVLEMALAVELVPRNSALNLLPTRLLIGQIISFSSYLLVFAVLKHSVPEPQLTIKRLQHLTAVF
jgi:hypothetical protein